MKAEGYTRVKQMIESDRFGLVSGAKEIIKNDLTELLGEYFALSSPVKLEIEGEEDNFNLVITCKSCRVKRFNLLK